jgi:hypothetical protein
MGTVKQRYNILSWYIPVSGFRHKDAEPSLIIFLCAIYFTSELFRLECWWTSTSLPQLQSCTKPVDTCHSSTGRSLLSSRIFQKSSDTSAVGAALYTTKPRPTGLMSPILIIVKVLWYLDEEWGWPHTPSFSVTRNTPLRAELLIGSAVPNVPLWNSEFVEEWGAVGSWGRRFRVRFALVTLSSCRHNLLVPFMSRASLVCR